MSDYVETALTNLLTFTGAAAVVIVSGFVLWGLVAAVRAGLRSLAQLRVRQVREGARG